MPSNALKNSESEYESLSARGCSGAACKEGSGAALVVLWGLMDAAVLLLLLLL
jgi:hypothetical protein